MNHSLTHLAFALLFLTVVGGAYAFGYHTVTREASRAAALSAQITESTDATARTIEIRAALAELAADEAIIAARRIAPEDISVFLSALEKTGSALGSTLGVVSVSDAPTDDRVNVSIKVTGTFGAVLRTIGAIEYGPYDVRTESLVLDADPSSQKAWTAAYVLSVGIATSSPALP